MKKYSDQFVEMLSEMGYTHCFYVAGGNIMHILESASKLFTCIPVVHEVTAGIAVEYFNEARTKGSGRAFALVTAGPGLTNIVTAMAGAYLESRELLVIGGQVKSSDLSDPGLRQKGIQEIDGIALVQSLCVETMQVRERLPKKEIKERILRGSSARKGPVFIEFCLDAQGAPALEDFDFDTTNEEVLELPNSEAAIDQILNVIHNYKRPVLLIGGGVSRETTADLAEQLRNWPFPIMTTWNGADRLSSESPSYFGRPNTWGQRYSNVILQQSDLLIAVGTRLGLQQTGFNWQEFMPVGQVVQVEIDVNELNKNNPKIDFSINHDANDFIKKLSNRYSTFENDKWKDWLVFSHEIKMQLPLSELINASKSNFVNPYDFMIALSERLIPGESVIPSSSGAAETVAMQAINQKELNTVITSKGLASMGYGLGGAIGCAVSTGNRVFHIEGDGGFAQNLQDLGTVKSLNLPIKTFILCNDGYASIRMTQKSYFNGNYLGCDSNTGLGLPNWTKLFEAFDIPVFTINTNNLFSMEMDSHLNSLEPCAFLISVDPEQTYFPKITSRVLADGSLESNPLHVMTPELEPDVQSKLLRYI